MNEIEHEIDVPEDDVTLDWDTRRFGPMSDYATDDEPATATDGDEQGDA